MSADVESVVGSKRTTQLIDLYARRLQAMDLLPDQTAWAVARAAYADACVYVVVAAGQVWRCQAEVAAESASAFVLALDAYADFGHCALCLDACGDYAVIPLHVLDTFYELVSWPELDEET